MPFYQQIQKDGSDNDEETAFKCLKFSQKSVVANQHIKHFIRKENPEETKYKIGERDFVFKLKVSENIRGGSFHLFSISSPTESLYKNLSNKNNIMSYLFVYML